MLRVRIPVTPIIDDALEGTCVWNPTLKQNVEFPYKEPFQDWWCRCEPLLSHLHPQIAEQWIHRHWKNSPYCYLPIERLRWWQEQWTAATIINDVFVTPNWGPHDPESDFEMYQSDPRFKDILPFTAFRQNQTWDYPIVVIQTPGGVRSRERIVPAPYCLIEGHVRIRALKAWHGRAPLAAKHSVFILTVDVAKGAAA